MRAPLRLAVVQPLCVPSDVAANALAHAALIRACGARAVVFPELSLTGYELAAPSITADDARLAPIIAACKDIKAVALAGAPVRDEDGRDFVATLIIDGTRARIES